MTAFGAPGGEIVVIAADEGAFPYFGGHIRVDSKILCFVPVTRRRSAVTAFRAPGGEIVLIATGESASLHFGGNVRVKSKIQSLVPVGSRTGFLRLDLRGGFPRKRWQSFLLGLSVRWEMCWAGGWSVAAARLALRKLGCQKIGESPDPFVGEARFQIFPVARKEAIEAEEVEADHGLLELPTGLCVEKRQHHFIAGGRRKAVVEDILGRPPGVLRVEPHFGARTAQDNRVGLDPPDLVWLYDGDVTFIERSYGIDPRKIRSPERVVGIHENDEGGEGERRYRNKRDQSDGKASKTGAGWRFVIGNLVGGGD